MIQVIPISEKGYNRAMLKALNGFLNLTDFEIDILACMLNNNVDILNKTNRLEVRNLLNKSEYTFNNYIKKLKDKKVLIPMEDGLAIHPTIATPIKDKEITVKFNVN